MHGLAGFTAFVFALLAPVALGTQPPLAAPPGLEFDATLSYSSDGDIRVSYVLNNVSGAPFVVRASDLKIYYGRTEVPYLLRRSPAPGRANRLSHNETEFGELTVLNPPVDSDRLQLVWPLFEIGPNLEHTLLISFGDIMNVRLQ